MTIIPLKLETDIYEIVSKHQLALEGFTKDVVTKAICEAISCGDFVTHISSEPERPNENWKASIGMFNPELAPDQTLLRYRVTGRCCYQPYARVDDLERQVEGLKARIAEFEGAKPYDGNTGPLK